MNNSKSCSKCSAKCTQDSERVLKNMQCEHTFCAQCIKEFDNHNSPQCPACQLPTITVQNSDPNKVTVRQPVTVLDCYTGLYYLLLHLSSLGLIICFIVLFSDKDSGIYDYTALGICLLIDLILIFICMCSFLFVAIIGHIKNDKGTKDPGDPEDPEDHNKILKSVSGFIICILLIVLLAGVGFCIWDIIVLAEKKNTFTTFTHIVLILSACYYGAFVLFIVGGVTTYNMACCKRPLC